MKNRKSKAEADFEKAERQLELAKEAYWKAYRAYMDARYAGRE